MNRRPIESEVTVPDAVSINSARVIVNQSNVVSTGGGTGSSASSVVDSDAARVAVRLGANGIEIASLDVHPGLDRGIALSVTAAAPAPLRIGRVGRRHHTDIERDEHLELGRREL